MILGSASTNQEKNLSLNQWGTLTQQQVSRSSRGMDMSSLRDLALDGEETPGRVPP